MEPMHRFVAVFAICSYYWTHFKVRQRFEELYCPPKMRLVMFGPNDPGSRDASNLLRGIATPKVEGDN
eukprot:4052861-Amphidinium_carterae.1